MSRKPPRRRLQLPLVALCFVSLLGANLPLAGGLAIIGIDQTDDGDDDGFADTNETVSVGLTVKNTSGAALTDVSVTLATVTPLLGCLTSTTIDVGNLAVDEVRQTDPFAFVPNVDRALLGIGPYDDLSVTFDVAVTAQEGVQPVQPPKLTFDLDLNVSGGSGPTLFQESFEGTLGQFEIDNMDANIYDLATSDGYRCQRHDPDWENSLSYGESSAPNCFLGINPTHASNVFWGLSGPGISPLGGRGFTGFHSLFFGIDLGPPKNWTTPMAVLEAARTTNPIALGDSPELSFVHQVSLVDDHPGYGIDRAMDRGVVMVQVADDLGNAVGNWFKIYPYQNGYASQLPPAIIHCMFDPIDDGSTEDDFFRPWDPDRMFGPSSTCAPEQTFVEMGETESPFDPANLGYAEGPGLAGSWGLGTWVESKVDLSRFHGRSVRLRFLATGIRILNHVDWDDFPSWPFNPNADDDGWWIDDVEVTGALTSASTVTADTADNSSLPGAPGSDTDADGIYDVCDNCVNFASPDGRDTDEDGYGDPCDTCPWDPLSHDGIDFDGDKVCVDNCPYVPNPNQSDFDGDGVGSACDCDPADPTIYPGAPEIADNLDNQCPGDPGFGSIDEISGNSGFHNPSDENEFSWTPMQGATRYAALRTDTPDLTTGCVLFQTTDTKWVDTTPVPPDSVFYYLVREARPFIGSWGQSSSGVERTLGIGCI